MNYLKTQTNMEAFHNDPSIKEKYLNRVQEHYQADQIIKGEYWQNGKGCAVGCTVHSNIHKNYESELGIPENIAHLQDTIFEGLPNKLAQQFPLQFLSAIKVGADLKNVSNLFTIWVLTDEKYGVLQYAENKKIVQDVADALAKDMVTPVPAEKWEKLRKNATAELYSSSYYAAAAYTAYTAAADSTYYSYAYSAAHATYSASSSSKSEYYIAASNKLIELLKQAN